MANNPSDQSELSDSALLRRFLSKADDTAFETLVCRHQQLVMGVCRRVLSDHEDAEDAFQATFMVLAKSARKIRKRATVSSWLYGVAYRVALRAARKRYRRREASLDEPILQDDNPFDNVSKRHELRVVDEELNCMPESTREPLVLRYMSGQTSPEIAKQLGLSVSAVEGRLKRGRKELGQRLARRGVGALAVAAAATVLRPESAMAHESLIEKVVTQGNALRDSLSVSQGTAGELAKEEVFQMSMLSQKVLATLGVTAVVMMVSVAGFLPSLLGQDGGAAPASGSASLEVSAIAEPEQDLATTIADPTESDPLDSTLEIANNAAPTSTTRSRAALRDIEAKLEKEIEGDFLDTPLSEFVEGLGAMLNIPVVFDIVALEDVGYAPEDLTVTLLGVNELSGRSMLRLALDQYDLTYIIEDEVLKITTLEEAEARADVRVYPAGLFGGQDLDSIIQLITSVVEVDSWDDVGGPGHIQAFGNSIVISNTQEVHEKVRDLISQLEEFEVKPAGPSIGPGVGR